MRNVTEIQEERDQDHCKLEKYYLKDVIANLSSSPTKFVLDILQIIWMRQVRWIIPTNNSKDQFGGEVENLNRGFSSRDQISYRIYNPGIDVNGQQVSLITLFQDQENSSINHLVLYSSLKLFFREFLEFIYASIPSTGLVS